MKKKILKRKMKRRQRRTNQTTGTETAKPRGIGTGALPPTLVLTTELDSAAALLPLLGGEARSPFFSFVCPASAGPAFAEVCAPVCVPVPARVPAIAVDGAGAAGAGAAVGAGAVWVFVEYDTEPTGAIR